MHICYRPMCIGSYDENVPSLINSKKHSTEQNSANIEQKRLSYVICLRFFSVFAMNSAPLLETVSQVRFRFRQVLL